MPSLQSAASSDPYQILADSLGRTLDTVHQDMRVISELRRDIKQAYNLFFVKKGAWLHDPLNAFQTGVVDRLSQNHQWHCEILPRFHTKTLLVSRIDVALRAMLGLERYQVIFSLGEDNYKGNLEAVWQVLTTEQFAGLQWFSDYIHINKPTRSDHVITLGNGSVIEFRSLLGESRGMNRAEAGGRPSRVILDDIMPTEAATSSTMREKILDRYLSMVVPIGGKGSKVTIVGTVMHKDDLLNQIRTERIRGYVVTPREHQRAYDEQTGKVLFSERWSLEDIMALKVAQYDAVGKSHLFRREILNDPSEDETNPLASYSVKRYEANTVLPRMLYRVIGVDHAHGTGNDWFIITEWGRDYHGKDYLLSCVRSKEWGIDARIGAVVSMVRRRIPAELVIEDTTESRSFIEVLEAEMRKAGVSVNLVRPSAASRGSKNVHIQSWIQPKLKAGELYFPEDEPYAMWFEHEASSFDITNKNNEDDFLDVTATVLTRLRKPTPDTVKTRYMRTGDPLGDHVLDTIEQGMKPKRKKKGWYG